MRRFITISFFTFFTFYGFAQTPLEFGQTYEIAYLQTQYDKALAAKDSSLLGHAAYLLHTHLEYLEGTSPKTIDLVTLSVQCFKAVGDSLKFHKVRQRLAEYYTESKLYKDAEKIYLGTKAFYQREEDWKLTMHLAARLARLYERMGNTQKYRKYYDESLELNKIVRDTLLEITFLMDRFHYYQNVKNPDSSILLAHRALMLSEAIQHPTFISLSQFQIGIMEQSKNNLDTAILYLNRAENSDRPIAYSGLRMVSFLHLSECYEQKKDFETALYFSRRYATLHDSILNKTRMEALDKMTIAYETKEKQTAINLLKKENEWNAILLSASALALVILFILLGFLTRFYREKIKWNKIVIEQNKTLHQQKIQSLEDAVQLTAIKAMLEGEEKERSRIARDLHDSLGGLLSTIKLHLGNLLSPSESQQNINQLLDRATSEVRDISQNLLPSSLKQFGLIPALKDLVSMYMAHGRLPKIDLQYYNIPKGLEESTELQLYRIIQEILHNALKYAQCQEIIIQLNGEPEGLSIVVEDDGIGFDLTKESSGNGLNNIRKRAKFLKAELTFESSERGTTVFLFLPL